MPTQPRSPSEHYQAAERLLAAAPETPESAVLAAIVHALLAAAPRRARKRPDTGAGPVPPSRPWVFGGDE
jgi:hypothetical protein